MAEQLDSKYDRFFSVVADQYGIDPLKDRVLPLILNIQSYSPHTVTQAERGSPDLIALNKYGTEKLWWVIMAYNGLVSYRDVVEGLQLRIPAIGGIVSVVTENSVARSSVERVISI